MAKEQHIRPSPTRYLHTLLVALPLAVMLLAASEADAARPRKQAPVAEEAATTAPAPIAGNTVAELRELMDANRLTELRTTYNGNYGASLLFNTENLHYYVALFHEREFWRVIKTDAVEDAEEYYRTFVSQTEELAQVYIDTIRLDAGKRFTERMVALNQQRLDNLQQELELQRQQSLQVSTALQQARQQAVSLSSDLQASHSELDTINKRIEALQALQANPQLSLPGPAESPVSVVPAMEPAPAATSPMP